MTTSKEIFYLTILGSGYFVPTLKRNCASHWVQAGNTNILLDCGAGALQQMLKAKKSYKNLDVIVISHLHPDHMTEFMQLLQLINHSYIRTKQFIIVGSVDTLRFVKQLQKSITDLLPRPNTYKLILTSDKTVPINNCLIETIKGHHVPSSIITKITFQEKTLVYTGDTGYDESIIPFIKNCDVLLTECSLPKEINMSQHLNVKTAGLFARKSQAKKLVLVHISEQLNPDYIRKKIIKNYKGKLIVGADLDATIID
jgi:ribonuclease BN (tRNA processing enzyme)